MITGSAKHRICHRETIRAVQESELVLEALNLDGIRAYAVWHDCNQAIGPVMKEQLTIPWAEAICSLCGARAKVVVSKAEAQPITDQKALQLFCEACALEGIRAIPQCPRLLITVCLDRDPEKNTNMEKEYEVIRINDVAQTAVIKDIQRGQRRGRRQNAGVITVRLDVIPEYHRSVGSSFRVIGLPLEIELFEKSGPV